MNRVGEIGNWVTFEACINIVFEMCSHIQYNTRSYSTRYIQYSHELLQLKVQKKYLTIYI